MSKEAAILTAEHLSTPVPVPCLPPYENYRIFHGTTYPYAT